MNRIVHFEIHASDPERTSKFYSSIFGWDFQKVEGMEPDYWLIMTAEKDSNKPGINGGMLRRMETEPMDGRAVNAFVCTIQVDDIDATIEKILATGGTEAMPKYAIMGMAWQAYYKDTEGNIFGVHQADTSAK